MKKSSINIVGLAVCAAFFLTSCAGGTDEPVKDPEPTATQHETTGPEETPEPEEPAVEEPVEPEEPELTADDFTAGEVLSEIPETLPKGVKAYEMPDGEVIVTKRYEPLPEEVLALVQKDLDDVIPPSRDLDPRVGDGSVDPVVRAQGINKIMDDYNAATGRKVVAIFFTPGICGDSGSYDVHFGWTNTLMPQEGCGVKKSLEDEKAWVNSVMDEHNSHHAYDVIIQKKPNL